MRLFVPCSRRPRPRRGNRQQGAGESVRRHRSGRHGHVVERYGEERLTKFLQTFSCPKNPEVERFLKDKAISSAKLSASQTYVVTEDATGLIVGYYTLVLKAYTVNGSKLSSANRRLVSRFAEADDLGNFHAAVYLIAQIGKNFAISDTKGFRCEIDCTIATL